MCDSGKVTTRRWSTQLESFVLDIRGGGEGAEGAHIRIKVIQNFAESVEPLRVNIERLPLLVSIRFVVQKPSH